MQQDRLDGLLTMFIGQKLAYNIYVDDVIQQFLREEWCYKIKILNIIQLNNCIL